MDWTDFLDSDLFRLIFVPLLIFVARVCDVSLGTLRMVFVSRGEKGRAAATGFFEVLIWLAAITYILQNLTNVGNYFAYALGFAAGNYLGLKIEEKMALGLLGVMVITNQDAGELIAHLKREKYGLTSVSARGATGKVRIVLSVIRRKNFEELRGIVERFHPQAFIAVQNVRSVTKQVYPLADHRIAGFFPHWRKGK